MAVLHHMRLAHKFLILGLIALVMALVPAGLYFGRALDDLGHAKTEIAGTEPMLAINEVIRYSQIHRGMSASMLSGNAALEARRPGVRDKLNAAMSILDAKLQAAQAPADLQTHWTDIKKTWVELEQAVASKAIDTPQSTQRHTALITRQLQLGEALLDAYRLSQDSGDDTFALVRATLVDMPWLAENMGIMRAMGSSFLTKADAPPAGRATLAALHKRARELQASMFRNIDRALAFNPDLKPVLAQGAADSRAAVDKTLTLAEREVILPATLSFAAVAYFDDFTRTSMVCLNSTTWP
ncbi:MAG: hypothetical protein Fur007_11690 [Rhodoferax sp.]